MRVSVCLGAIRIPEYLDFHSGYSAPRSYYSITHLKMPSIETDSESSLIYKLCCLLHI